MPQLRRFAFLVLLLPLSVPASPREDVESLLVLFNIPGSTVRYFEQLNGDVTRSLQRQAPDSAALWTPVLERELARESVYVALVGEVIRQVPAEDLSDFMKWLETDLGVTFAAAIIDAPWWNLGGGGGGSRGEASEHRQAALTLILDAMHWDAAMGAQEGSYTLSWRLMTDLHKLDSAAREKALAEISNSALASRVTSSRSDSLQRFWLPGVFESLSDDQVAELALRLDSDSFQRVIRPLILSSASVFGNRMAAVLAVVGELVPTPTEEPMSPQLKSLLAQARKAMYPDSGSWDLESMIPLAQQLSELAPDHPRTLTFLAVAILASGNAGTEPGTRTPSIHPQAIEQAMESLNKALAIDETNAETLMWMGYAQAAASNTDKAKEFYDRASAFDPTQTGLAILKTDLRFDQINTMMQVYYDGAITQAGLTPFERSVAFYALTHGLLAAKKNLTGMRRNALMGYLDAHPKDYTAHGLLAESLALYVNLPDQAEQVLSRVPESEWDKLHFRADTYAKAARAQALYQKKQTFDDDVAELASKAMATLPRSLLSQESLSEHFFVMGFASPTPIANAEEMDYDPVSGEFPLADILAVGNTEMFMAFVSAGASVNADGPYPQPPLIVALYQDSPDLVAFILENGGDPTVTTPDGRGWEEHLAALEDYGMDVSETRALITAALTGDDVQATTEDAQILIDQAAALLDTYPNNRAPLSQAQSRLQRAMAIDLELPQAYVEMSRYVMKSAGRFTPSTLSQAEHWLRQGLQIDPDHGNSYVLLGYVHTHQRRSAEALAAFSKAEALNASSPWLGVNHGELLNNEKRFDEAIRVLKKALAASGVPAQVRGAQYKQLARAYEGTGQYQLAKTAHENRIETTPGLAYAMQDYAHFLRLRLLETKASETWARKALDTMSYGAGRQTLGKTLYLRWAEALIDQQDLVLADQYFEEAKGYVEDPYVLYLEIPEYPRGHAIIPALISLGHSMDRNAGGGPSPLVLAAANNNPAVVRALVEHGANVNRAGPREYTPLLIAAHSGHLEMVELLLSLGADPHARNYQGKDGAALAGANSFPQVAALLEQAMKGTPRDGFERLSDQPFRTGFKYIVKRDITSDKWGVSFKKGEQLNYARAINYSDPSMTGFLFMPLNNPKAGKDWAIEKDRIGEWVEYFQEVALEQ